MWNWVGENAIALVGLFSTFALLGVTAGYAKTTKDMSETAQKTASDSARATEAAMKAAEAARDSVAVAQSQVQPEFSAKVKATLQGSSLGSVVRLVILESTGHPVVVHKVAIRRALRQSESDKIVDRKWERVGDELFPFDAERTLPLRMHRGSVLDLRHPVEEFGLEPDPWCLMELEVQYSFSEDPDADVGGVYEVRVDLSTPPLL